MGSRQGTTFPTKFVDCVADDSELGSEALKPGRGASTQEGRPFAVFNLRRENYQFQIGEVSPFRMTTVAAD